MYMRLGRGFIEDFNLFYLEDGIKLKERYKEEVKERIVFFCMQKCDENKNNIIELLSYMNNNFIFDQNLEIKEIKKSFLDVYKNELKNSINVLWIQEKRKPNLNLIEKFSALKFIIDFNNFIKEENNHQLYFDLCAKQANINLYIIKEFSLEKYFINNKKLNVKEVSKILFNFELSFSLFDNKISTFKEFISNKEIFLDVIKHFKYKKDKEEFLHFKASEIIEKLESGKNKFILQDMIVKEKDYLFCNLVEIEIYSYNIEEYLSVLKSKFEKEGEFLVHFSLSNFKRVYKSHIFINSVSERVVSILFFIKNIQK